MTADELGHFFDGMTGQYTETIERCFPRYREMLWALLRYLPELPPAPRILELGCGTGNLTVLLAARYPEARIEAMDISTESLAVARQRLNQNDRIHFQSADMQALDANATFDLVVSSIAIHHLNSSAKRTLFTSIHRCLHPNGCFAYADQFRGMTDAINEIHMDGWKTLTYSAGSNEEEWAMWMDHQRNHDVHDTLQDQFSWLRSAGFENVDCVWRYLLWSVLVAHRV